MKKRPQGLGKLTTTVALLVALTLFLITGKDFSKYFSMDNVITFSFSKTLSKYLTNCNALSPGTIEKHNPCRTVLKSTKANAFC